MTRAALLDELEFLPSECTVLGGGAARSARAEEMAGQSLPICIGRPAPTDIGGVNLTSRGVVAPCATDEWKKCNCTYDMTELHSPSVSGSNASSCSGTAAATLVGTFYLQNVCVKYPHHRLAVADFISTDGTCAEILAYSEYSASYRHISKVRRPHDGEDLSRCERHSLGLGIRFSSSNFYHQLNFAASAHETFLRIGAPDAVFVPIGHSFPRTAPDGLWEFTLRGLSNASAARLTNQTNALLKANCTCFGRVVAATHAMQPASPRSREAFAAFRHSSAVHARMVSMHAVRDGRRRSTTDMLFIVRHGPRRVITNEDAVRLQALAAEPRLRFVAFETMPIVQQLKLVGESSTLIGVHGMALAGYIVHLPTHEWTTACVEIQPAANAFSWTWTAIMRDLAAGAGVLHLALTARRAPGCFIDFMLHANCSLKKDWEPLGATSPGHCKLALSKAFKSFAASSVLNCNITVDSRKLLGLIEKAARHTLRGVINHQSRVENDRPEAEEDLLIS